MGAIIALIVVDLIGSLAPGGTVIDPAAPPSGNTPQHITAPKRYLSHNAYCSSVSNGCTVCYRDDGGIVCTEASAACRPRPAFRCNRF
jgi:hypothetical protein